MYQICVCPYQQLLYGLEKSSKGMLNAQILSVDELGGGIKAIRPQSLLDMMKVSALC